MYYCLFRHVAPHIEASYYHIRESSEKETVSFLQCERLSGLIKCNFEIKINFVGEHVYDVKVNHTLQF